MVHIEFINDSSGDVVGVNYYCGDFCHREGAEEYGGWNGCHEILSPETCKNCRVDLPFNSEEDESA